MVVHLCMIIRGAEYLQLTDGIVEKIENALYDDQRLIVDELSVMLESIYLYFPPSSQLLFNIGAKT